MEPVVFAAAYDHHGQQLQYTWSKQDQEKDVAAHLISSSPDASHHAIRLNKSEKPHVHKEHDAVVFLMRGKVRFHMGLKTVLLKAGDVFRIERGTVHWAENLGPEAAEAYAIFAPPYDGTDMVLTPG
jgi:mannose-6-phosphate isomerase-like protein (cupin superfamily)